MEDVSDFSARKLMERNIMKKIILDLDTGIDDTLALSYILGSEDAELIGITGTYGNVLLETGIRNDLRPFAVWCGWVCQVVTVLRSSLPQVR